MIHPMAHVDADVTLGEGTKVWQFASVTRGAILGERCSVSPHAMLDGSQYGNGVIISGGVMAGAGFKVGDDVFLGPNVVLCNDLWPFTTKDGYADAELRGGKVFAVIIEDGVAVGAGAVILPGVRVGRGAVISAGAVVGRDVRAGAVYMRDNSTARDVPENWKSRRMLFAC